MSRSTRGVAHGAGAGQRDLPVKSCQLRPRPEVTLLDAGDERATVAVVVADSVDEETVPVLRSQQRSSCQSILVVTHIDDTGLAAAVEANNNAPVCPDATVCPGASMADTGKPGR